MADVRYPALVDIERYMQEKGKTFQEAVQDLIARAEGLPGLPRPSRPEAPQGIERQYKMPPSLPLNDGRIAPATGSPIPDPRRSDVPLNREPDRINAPLKNYGVSKVGSPGDGMGLTEFEAFAKQVAESAPEPVAKPQPERFQRLKSQLSQPAPSMEPQPQGMIELSEDPEEMQRQIENARLQGR